MHYIYAATDIKLFMDTFRSINFSSLYMTICSTLKFVEFVAAHSLKFKQTCIAAGILWYKNA